MFRRTLIGVALALGLVSSAHAQGGIPIEGVSLKRCTVGTLDTCGGTSTDAYTVAVTDALSKSDCSGGGGTEVTLCQYDLSADTWEPVGSGGGGGGGDPTLAGDVDGLGSANDLDQLAVETELEQVVDLSDLQGTLPIAKLDAIDTPANGEQYTYDGATGRGRWDASGGGGSDSELTLPIATGGSFALLSSGVINTSGQFKAIVADTDYDLPAAGLVTGCTGAFPCTQAAGESVIVTVRGLVTGIDTTAMISPTYEGYPVCAAPGSTTVSAALCDHRQARMVGTVVTRHATTGRLLVDPGTVGARKVASVATGTCEQSLWSWQRNDICIEDANNAVKFCEAVECYGSGWTSITSTVPNSAALRAQLSDETGTGAAMFGLTPAMSDELSCFGLGVPRRNAGDNAFECVIPNGVILGSYNNSPPAACVMTGDLHTDIDTGAVFQCTDSATESFRRFSAWSPLRFWVENETAATLTNTKCLLYGEGDFLGNTAVTCTSTSGVLESAVLFPVGAGVFASKLSCAATGSGVTGTLVLDVRFRRGDAPGTQSDSAGTLSIPAANFTSTIQSATINGACPYNANGCMVSLHVKTALGAGTGIDLSCDLLHASY